MLVERLSAEGLPHEQSGVDYLAECYKRLEQRRPLHKVRDFKVLTSIAAPKSRRCRTMRNSSHRSTR